MNWELISRHLFFSAGILLSAAWGIWYGRRTSSFERWKYRIKSENNGRIGNCQRWNIQRGKPCTCGSHFSDVFLLKKIVEAASGPTIVKGEN